MNRGRRVIPSRCHPVRYEQETCGVLNQKKSRWYIQGKCVDVMIQPAERRKWFYHLFHDWKRTFVFDQREETLQFLIVCSWTFGWKSSCCASVWVSCGVQGLDFLLAVDQTASYQMSDAPSDVTCPSVWHVTPETKTPTKPFFCESFIDRNMFSLFCCALAIKSVLPVKLVEKLLREASSRNEGEQVIISPGTLASVFEFIQCL